MAPKKTFKELMQAKKVAVYHSPDKRGEYELIGHVHPSTTSIGAARMAKKTSAKYTRVDGKYGWVVEGARTQAEADAFYKKHPHKRPTGPPGSKVKRSMQEGALDTPTPSPDTIAQQHGVSLDHINAQLEKGIKVEQEHTSNPDTAREIALDHLGEDPNYYSKLAKIEEGARTHVAGDARQKAKDFYNSKIKYPINPYAKGASGHAEWDKHFKDEERAQHKNIGAEYVAKKNNYSKLEKIEEGTLKQYQEYAKRQREQEKNNKAFTKSLRQSDLKGSRPSNTKAKKSFTPDPKVWKKMPGLSKLLGIKLHEAKGLGTMTIDQYNDHVKAQKIGPLPVPLRGHSYHRLSNAELQHHVDHGATLHRKTAETVLAFRALGGPQLNEISLDLANKVRLARMAKGNKLRDQNISGVSGATPHKMNIQYNKATAAGQYITKRWGWPAVELKEAKHTLYKLHGVSQSYDPQTEKWTSDHTEQEVLASSRRHALNKTLKKLQTLHPHHKYHEVTIQESDLKAQWNADFTKDSYARRKNLRRTIQQQLVPKTPGLGNRAWLRADKEEKKNRSSVYSVHEAATTSSSGMSFDEAIAHATKHGGKIVFGTNSQKWHSISPQDRDYDMSHASDPQDAKRVGEKQAKWGVRSVARSVINRKTVQEAFQAAKNKKGSKVKSADFDTPKDLKSKGDQDPGQDEVQSKPPQFGSKDQENPQDAPDQKPKNNAPKPEKKGTKLVVKGPGPDDAFQKDPEFTPVSTLVAAAGVR